MPYKRRVVINPLFFFQAEDGIRDVAVTGVQTCALPISELFDQLQVEGNAHAVDEHDALVEQLLVGDFRIDEFLKLGARADELDGFGGFLGRRRKLVKHGKVEQLELHIRRNALRNVFQQRRQEKVE